MNHTIIYRRAVMLALLAAACRGGIDGPLEPQGVSTIEFSPVTATADNAAVVAITVRVDPAALPADGKVMLTTSLGSFLGGSTSSISLPFDTAGVARAQLRAPDRAGVAQLTATAAGVTRYYEYTFGAAPVTGTTRGVLDVTATPASALADSASVITVKVTVDTSPRPTPYSITITTTAGSLLGGTSATTLTVPVNDSGFAYARLRVPSDAGIALIAATAGGVTRYGEIVFDPAPPTAVQLTTDFALKAGAANSTSVTALLLRTVGSPSPGAIVTFSADTADGSGGAFGQFSPRAAVSGSRSVTTRFSVGDTPYRGRVVLRVHATRNSATVTDSTWVQITSP